MGPKSNKYSPKSVLLLFLERTKVWGRIFGFFYEAIIAVNTYIIDLLGLLSIDLLFLSVKKVEYEQLGYVEIVSDCLGSLGKVFNIPPH